MTIRTVCPARHWLAPAASLCGLSDWRIEWLNRLSSRAPKHPHRNLQTVNPATGEPGRSYDPHSLEQSLEAAKAARGAFLDWRKTSFADRATVIRKAAEILRARKDEFARLMTEEMGKTLDDGRAEVEKCAFHCDWFADHAHDYLANEPADIGGGEAFVTFNPIGVVLAVMPWNFPFWQVFRAAAPALMAGNGMLLKHASNVPGCALAIEDVLHQAGVPKDLFRTLLLPSSEVEALIKDDNVAAVTLTGSVPAGRSVATAAGSVLKKCVLELGGADAYVVLEDADLERGRKGRGDGADGQWRAELHRRQALHRRSLDPGAIRKGAGRGDARLRNGRSGQGRHQARTDAERQGPRRDP